MNILIICNDKNLLQDLSGKLVFLRKDDEICKSDYSNAVNDVAIKLPDVILLCETPDIEETLCLIKVIRKKTNVPIILTAKILEQDFVLQAYDAGANDFVPVDISDYELVIRVINNIKINSQNRENERFVQLLEQLKVIDDVTGIFKYEFSKQIIENYIDKEMISNGTFMIIAPTQESKTYFSTEKLANSIKLSIRKNDILTFGKGINFYIFMPKTDMNGAVSVLNKIKENIDFSICAGIADIINRSFEDFEHSALKALSESSATGKDFNFAEETQAETLDDWLYEKNSLNDYKIFRQMFNKKLDKVITPILYRLQKSYEEKLFNTEIEQYVTDDQCVFNLKNKKGNGSLKIIYPGFAKITILISYEGLDTPENRELKLPLAKITQKELVLIIEDFIKEFKENVIDR